MKLLRLIAQLCIRTVDALIAMVVVSGFLLWSLLLLVKNILPRHKGEPKSLLYVGYTTLDQAQSKGLLKSVGSIQMTYNPSKVLNSVTILIPFGKRAHVTALTEDITFVEIVSPLQSTHLLLTSYVTRIAKGCIETYKYSRSHEVVMVGGPHVASLPALYARLTTPARFVLFIEAFWEDILPQQLHMSKLQKLFWFRWYKLLYKVFDAYVGGPSFKPDFYVARGMAQDRIWPYIHQIDAVGLESESACVELPLSLKDVPLPWIVSIGRLENEKLSADCVEVSRLLVSRGLDFRMIMVGDGSQREALQATIDRNQLTETVILVGAQRNAVAYAIARHSDYCFAPYMGTALVEVMLAGCVVVAYDNDPHRGIAGDGPIKFVPSGDILAAANELENLLRNRCQLSVLKVETKIYAEKKWNPDAIAAAYMAPLAGRK